MIEFSEALFSAMEWIDSEDRRNQAGYSTTLAVCASIESAINNFHREYGYLPASASTESPINTAQDTNLLRSLLGMENRLNTRETKFLAVRDGKHYKNGLIYSSDSLSIVGLYDTWGGGFHVLMDVDGDGSIAINPGSGKRGTGRVAVVWSDGPDGTSCTDDDVTSW